MEKTTKTYIVENGKQFNNELSRILKAIKLETLSVVTKDEKKDIDEIKAYETKVINAFGGLNLNNPIAKSHIEYYQVLNAWQKESKAIIKSVTSLYIDDNDEIQASAYNFVSNIIKCVDSQLKTKKRYNQGFENLYIAWKTNNIENFNKAFHVLYGIRCDNETITRINALGLGNNKLLSLNAFRNALNSAFIVVLKKQGYFSTKLVKSSINKLLENVKVYKDTELYNRQGDMLSNAVNALCDIYDLELPKNPNYINKCARVKRDLLNKKIVVMPSSLVDLSSTIELGIKIESLKKQAVKKALGNTKETKQETQENK